MLKKNVPNSSIQAQIRRAKGTSMYFLISSGLTLLRTPGRGNQMKVQPQIFDGNENCQKGVTTVEYAVMLVMVALAVIALGTGIGGAVTGVFNNLMTQL